MSETTIPAFIDAIVGLGEGMTAVIRDGPQPTDEVPDAELFVGMRQFDDEDLSESVSDGEQQWATTNRTKDERYRLRCLAVGRNGTDNMALARGLAFATVEELGVLLRADPTVGGVIMYCDLEVRDVNQGFTEDDGAVCRVQFDIRARARI